MLKYHERLFPMYILNQNYIRFNNCIVNCGMIHHFCKLQKFSFGNFFIPKKGEKAKKIMIFIKYDFY